MTKSYPHLSPRIVKKMSENVDNLSANEEKKLRLILQIQELRRQGIGIREIGRRLGISRATVKKYMEGNPYILCRSGHRSELDQYTDYIIKCIQEGKTKSEIAESLTKMGYKRSKGNAIQYISRIAKEHGLEVKKYRSDTDNCSDSGADKAVKWETTTRKGIFNFLWMNGKLTSGHYDYLWEKYPVLKETELCIREFREIFAKKSMPLLYLFIEKYKWSEIKELSGFASGLEKDMEAVENAVASDLSNGFVEGTNNKLKMIKRTMYGRCGKTLLTIKLIYGNEMVS